MFTVSAKPATPTNAATVRIGEDSKANQTAKEARAHYESIARSWIQNCTSYESFLAELQDYTTKRFTETTKMVVDLACKAIQEATGQPANPLETIIKQIETGYGMEKLGRKIVKAATQQDEESVVTALNTSQPINSTFMKELSDLLKKHQLDGFKIMGKMNRNTGFINFDKVEFFNRMK